MGARSRLVALPLAAFGAVAYGCGGSIASNAGSDAAAQDAALSPSVVSGGSSGSSSGSDAVTASSSGSLSPSDSGSGDRSSGSGGSSGGSSSGNGGSGSSGGGAQDAAIICTPKTCADFPTGTCSIQSDGCGGVTAQCGIGEAGLCPAGEYCGGGGPSLCGSGFLVGDGGTDGAGSSSGSGGCPGGCCPKTCADYPGNVCGFQSDGCGGLTAQCAATDAGVCPAGQFCGGSGPGLCGTGFPGGDAGAPPDASSGCGQGNCVPLTCANFPASTCGRQDDGCCGLTADCGGCGKACDAGADACPADAAQAE